MATDNNTPLSAKLAPKPYSVRLNADRVKLVSHFLQANNLDNLPDIGSLFFYLLDNYGKQPVNNDNATKEAAEREKLRSDYNNVCFQNSQLYEENKELKRLLDVAAKPIREAVDAVLLEIVAELGIEITAGANSDEIARQIMLGFEKRAADNNNTNTPAVNNPEILPAATSTGLELLDDPNYPQLRWFKQFVTDKTQNIGDVLIAYRRSAEAAIHGMLTNPLMLLDDNEYAALSKWDKETFVPQLAEMIGPEKLAEYGITNLADVLTGKHKFMMMWDFCLSDPSEKIRQLLPNLPDEVVEQLNDLSFPRPQIVLQCLDDIAEKIDTINQTEDDTTKLVEQTETTTEGATTEPDTPVIDIATRQPVDTASPETIEQG